MSELIIALPDDSSLEAFTDEKTFDALLEAIRNVVDGHTPDVTTVSGRKAIASLAHKVAKTKTALDARGKALTDEWRTKTNLVNASRKKMREDLDALKDRARRPLTEWEAAENQRQEAHKGALSKVSTLATFSEPPTPGDVRTALAELEALSAREWEEHRTVAEPLISSTQATLNEALSLSEKRAAEQLELERLRQEAAERARLDEQRLAEQRAKEAEAKAAEERARAEQAAADRARREAELAAQRAIEEEREKAAAAIAEAERKEQQRLAEEEKVRAEEARRAADIEHRRAINKAASDAIIALTGLSNAKAERLVSAIVSGGIPSVSIKY